MCVLIAWLMASQSSYVVLAALIIHSIELLKWKYEEFGNTDTSSRYFYLFQIISSFFLHCRHKFSSPVLVLAKTHLKLVG